MIDAMKNANMYYTTQATGWENTAWIMGAVMTMFTPILALVIVGAVMRGNEEYTKSQITE